jgi:transcription antitermination factor NusA-like protein
MVQINKLGSYRRIKILSNSFESENIQLIEYSPYFLYQAGSQ